MSEPYLLTTVKNTLSDKERTELYALIDKIDEDEREWNKVDVLIKTPSYMEFLEKVTEISQQKIEAILLDYKNDTPFKEAFLPNLKILGAMPNAGDLRFHAITLYVMARSLKPENILETGVAQGKSSAILLLALNRNNAGSLFSIDLPNPSGKLLADGAFTSTGARDVGWLVPDYLRDRWNLTLGDSKIELPKIVVSLDKVELFFHDSLHTYEHVMFEIETVLTKMKKGLIVIDNLETEAGKAFEAFIAKHNLVGFAFSNLGVIKVSS